MVGEETEISPSYSFWFEGCNLTCSFCSTRAAQKRSSFSPALREQSVSQAMRCVEDGTARSISLIGGEPSVSLAGSIGLAAIFRGKTKVVFNTNLYLSEDALELVAHAADTFIVDIHFGCERCARVIAGAENYLEIMTRNLQSLQHKDVLLRHLLLPGHIDCCLPGVVEIVSRFPDWPFSLLTNFHPFGSDAGGVARLGPLDLETVERAEEILTTRGIRFRTIGPDSSLHSPGYFPSGVPDETIEVTIDRDGAVVFEAQSPSVPEIARSL
ncbi:MAG: radical SAM protein [Candidatus Coatesbacteria bacterium]|nr:radical SAM protein [Candidatus Coatesbacteria bacterium]